MIWYDDDDDDNDMIWYDADNDNDNDMIWYDDDDDADADADADQAMMYNLYNHHRGDANASSFDLFKFVCDGLTSESRKLFADLFRRDRRPIINVKLKNCVFELSYVYHPLDIKAMKIMKRFECVWTLKSFQTE